MRLLRHVITTNDQNNSTSPPTWPAELSADRESISFSQGSAAASSTYSSAEAE